MPKYKVTLHYRYTDIQEVEADSREEAVDIAEGNADEQYDCYLDNEVIELEEDD